MFLGRYEHIVDSKGRIAIPAKFRAELGERMYVTRWLDKCLALYSASAFEALAAKVSALSIADQNARLLRRIFFSDAAELEFDRQGRINLPSHLRDFAGIGAAEAEAVLVGANDYIELWAKDRWAEVQNQVEDDPNAIAAQLAQLGVI
ncbi:MAG: division/cell wall cluster transcriptional repressor MraZ [Chloroflexi bacterium]|nr:division/cell wall cluster transcriptional repressor MraZ [Chloroflexota bacterium]